MKDIIPWKHIFTTTAVILGIILFYTLGDNIEVLQLSSILNLFFQTILPIIVGTYLFTTLFLSKPQRQLSLQVLLSWVIYFLCIYSTNISIAGTLLPVFFPIGLVLLLLFIHSKNTLAWVMIVPFLSIQLLVDVQSMSLPLSLVLLHSGYALFSYYLGSFLTHCLHLDNLIYKCIFDKEYRRQAAHAVFGITLAYLIYVGLLTSSALAIIILAGLALIILVKNGYLGFLSHVLLIFERPHHFERFPGRGIFYFVCGAFLVSLFAPIQITAASILILALGDSITNIVGKDLGKNPLPYNKKKNIEGPLTGAFFGALMASLLVPLPHAIAAALVAMFVETLPHSYGRFEIDDNITIPVTAALILLVF